MSESRCSPSFRFSTLFLVGLSLSIGWGIRGNFGHEYGAAFAGCLAALTVCLLSGREDWRRRVAYFALFGALGWGFGGSISYMQVIAYTHSGHGPSQLYGFFALFYIGFLWAALGGAGTALPAVADRDRLTQFFKPILFVFATWAVLFFFGEWAVQALSSQLGLGGERRHLSPLYWFDADYLPALFALLGLCLFDIWDRRHFDLLLLGVLTAGLAVLGLDMPAALGKGGWEQSLHWATIVVVAALFLVDLGQRGIQSIGVLPILAAAGGFAGWGIQTWLRAEGLDQTIAAALTYPLGDPTLHNPADLLINWPQWFSDSPQHIGWLIGSLVGSAGYFVAFGRFRSGASLFLYMALGWFACFLAFPVLGSVWFTKIGGLRMTPPRADDWAGITGVFIGMTIWMFRHRMKPVAFASVVSGFIGGLGFSGMQWLKLMLMSLGNPAALAARGLSPESAEFVEKVERWSAWQGQNWHSFLEQTYGFVNGLAIAVALGLLARRVPVQEEEEPQRRWTEAFAAFFVLLGLTYLNLAKNVATWANGLSKLNPGVWKRVVTLADGATQELPPLWDVPLVGRLPGLGFLEMQPSWWFGLTWLLFTGAFLLLARRHLRKPLAVVPRTSLGKGQLIFLILLWAMVIGNFERALTGWGETRLLTEWVIFVNATIATVLVLLCPRDEEIVAIAEPRSFVLLHLGAWAIGLVCMFGAVSFFHHTNRAIYQDKHTASTRPQLRFGSEAEWRIRPNLRSGEHR